MSTGKFHYHSPADLAADIAGEGLSDRIPLSEELAVLREPKTVEGSDVTLKNRLTVHPLEGFDSTPDGAPGELTYRRIRRMASGGAGLIWAEATAVTEDGRTNRGQLWITRKNLDAFKRMAEIAHEASRGAPVILQLTHSGRFSKPDNTPRPVIAMHNPVMNEKMMIDPAYPVVTDDYLDTLPEIFGQAGASEGAGIKLVKETAAHLAKSGNARFLPQLVWTSGCKYLGYRLGKGYKRLPMSLIRRLTDNAPYWARMQ